MAAPVMAAARARGRARGLGQSPLAAAAMTVVTSLSLSDALYLPRSARLDGEDMAVVASLAPTLPTSPAVRG